MFMSRWSIRYKVVQSRRLANLNLANLYRTLFTTPSYPGGDLGEIE